MNSVMVCVGFASVINNLRNIKFYYLFKKFFSEVYNNLNAVNYRNIF